MVTVVCREDCGDPINGRPLEPAPGQRERIPKNIERVTQWAEDGTLDRKRETFALTLTAPRSFLDMSTLTFSASPENLRVLGFVPSDDRRSITYDNGFHRMEGTGIYFLKKTRMTETHVSEIVWTPETYALARQHGTFISKIYDIGKTPASLTSPCCEPSLIVFPDIINASEHGEELLFKMQSNNVAEAQDDEPWRQLWRILNHLYRSHHESHSLTWIVSQEYDQSVIALVSTYPSIRTFGPDLAALPLYAESLHMKLTFAVKTLKKVADSFINVRPHYVAHICPLKSCTGH